jgi:hypothetical protein
MPRNNFFYLEGECKKFYLEYMLCLAENDHKNEPCRQKSKVMHKIKKKIFCYCTGRIREVAPRIFGYLNCFFFFLGLMNQLIKITQRNIY